MSKILILSGSPQRDRLIDALLKRKLEQLDNEATIGPLPVGSREAILDIKPDILITPPPKNIFGFDLLDEASYWGVATAIRHIEPGCDKKDLEVMSDQWKKILLCPRPPMLNVEFMWGMPEAEYVSQHMKTKYPIMAVGAFVADVYKDEGMKKDIPIRSEFIGKHQFKSNHKTVLLSSPWGLLDMDSDLPGQSHLTWAKDNDAKLAWLKMAEDLATEIGSEYNILATLHPAVPPDDYVATLTKLGISIDYRSPAFELLSNCDFLVHSGSTMAVEMHWLDKPSFQFGDVNSLDLSDGNWWQRRGCAISRVSPFFLKGQEIANAIKQSAGKSNADNKAIKELEAGRYGEMDGHATDRMVSVLGKLKGKFRMKWPRPRINLSGLICAQQPERYLAKMTCQICNNNLWGVREDWLKALLKEVGTAPQEDLIRSSLFKKTACPFCGSPIQIKSKLINVSEYKVAGE